MNPSILLRIAVVASVLLAVGLTPAARADDETVVAELLRRVTSLEAENAYLKAHLQALEAKLAAPSAGGGVSGAPAATDADMPVMRFTGVSLLQADPGTSQQIQQLKADADAAEQQGESLQSQIGQMMDQSATASGDGTSNNVTMGQRLALRRQMAAAYDQMTRKRAQAGKLQQQLDTPPQVVTGWDGQRTVTLIVDPQFAGVVNALNPGDFVAWRGNRSQLTDSAAQYDRVWALQKTQRPSGFKDPSGGAARN